MRAKRMKVINLEFDINQQQQLQEILDKANKFQKLNVILRGDTLIVNDENIEINKWLDYILAKISKHKEIINRDLIVADYLEMNDVEVITHFFKGNNVYPKTHGQLELLNALKSNDIVLVNGPAGTGKTFLCVAYAIKLLRQNYVNKIVLTRPAVEAGESFGFLPGDLKEKIDPYLAPLYDALYRLIGEDTTNKYIEKKIIEIAPLAYMRGRTLDNAFIILDEAQNTTITQMLMFLTRLGFNSKMAVAGDLEQIDLKYNKDSGLKDAFYKLKAIQGIKLVTLNEEDVVRHPLVTKIIKAYQNNN